MGLRFKHGDGWFRRIMEMTDRPIAPEYISGNWTIYTCSVCGGIIKIKEYKANRGVHSKCLQAN